MQSVVMADRDRDKEKVAYRSSGWLPKGVAHASRGRGKAPKPTRSTSSEAAGGPR